MAKERLVGLDLFRIFAVLVVFLFHSSMHIGCRFGILQPFINNGAMLMTAFFILSGFALSYSNDDKDLLEISNIKIFYSKRFISIFPLYWISALIYTILAVGCLGESVLNTIVLFPIEVIGFQSVFTTLFTYNHNGGTWFISCLVFCYLLFPFYNSIVRQLSTKNLLILLLIVYAILFYSPVVHVIDNVASIYSNPVFRALEFLIGIIVYRLWLCLKCKQLPFNTLYSGGAVLILITAVTLSKIMGIPNKDYMLYNWFAIPLYIIFLLCLCTTNFNRLKNLGVINYFANISYAVFLAQLFCFKIYLYIIALFEVSNESIRTFIKFPMSFAICIIVAIVLHELFEKPIKKFFKRKFIIS